MRRVLKWPVPVDGTIHRIGSGRICLVGVQPTTPGCVCVWTEESSERPAQTREVIVFGTGHEIPIDSLEHLGSVVDGRYVWHLFERVRF